MIKNGLSREKLLVFLKKSSLFTDKFFSLCLKNKDFNPMQYLIRLLLNNDKIVITNVVGQYQITSSGGKITVFDAYGEEIKTVEAIDPKTQKKTTKEIKIRYNIEIQRVSAGADPKRARFYSATFDAENLGEKQDYKDLTESYIIFITEHDVLNETISRRLEIFNKIRKQITFQYPITKNEINIKPNKLKEIFSKIIEKFLVFSKNIKNNNNIFNLKDFEDLLKISSC